MIAIRTQSGRMYGTLDLKDYAIHIKDGSIVRVVKIPAEGTKLLYIAANNMVEEICVPPKSTFT